MRKIKSSLLPVFLTAILSISVIAGGHVSAQDNVRMLPNYSPGSTQNSEANGPPTLIISIPGIGSYAKGASGEKIFAEVQDMFGTKEKGFSISTINIYDVTRQGGPQMAPESQQWEAQQLAKDITSTPYRVVRFQTEIPGIDDLLKVNLLYKLARPRISLGNNPLDINFYEAKIKTRWEEETRRGALSVEDMARAFKDKYGKDARVILVGHSAGTDLINSVPMTDTVNGGKRQLIDLRVLSSARAHTLNEMDKDRTVFVEHRADLPASPMADLSSPMAKGDLGKQGYVLMMRGGIDFGLSDLIIGHYNIKAHNKTFDYNNPVDMTITAPGGDKIHTSFTDPGKIILEIMKTNEEEKEAKEKGVEINARQKLIDKVEFEKSKGSVDGGVSLGKPADVPINPADIRELKYEPPASMQMPGLSYGGFSFLMKNGDRIYFPHVRSAVPGMWTDTSIPEIEAAAFMCVYNEQQMIVPEISISFEKDAQGIIWKIVDYRKGTRILTFSTLGDMLLKTDHYIGDVAFGQIDPYRMPRIENYHPYLELAWDNKLVYPHVANEKPKRGVRVWIEPSLISTELFADRLEYKRINIDYHFESYDLDTSDDYFAGKVKGYSDPAGEFLAAQLTSNFTDLFRLELPTQSIYLEPAAGVTGILIWARQHNIYVSKSTRAAVRAVVVQNQQQIMSKDTRFVQLRGNSLVARDPAGKEREVRFEDIKRPTPIFNQYGLSRLLWADADSSESKIEYNNNGLISKLIGRKHDITKIFYNNGDRRPLAIVDSKGSGVAVIWTDSLPILCKQVRIDADSREVVFNKRSQCEIVDDVDDVFGNLYAAWIHKQAVNEPTEAWLTKPPEWYEFSLAEVLVMLGIGIVIPFLVRRFTTAGSIRMSWALYRIGAKGYETPKRAAERLGKSRQPQVALALVKKIQKRKGILDSFHALEKMGAPAVEPLIGLLKDQDVNVRGNAAEALGNIGDPRAVKSLEDLISREGNNLAWLEAVRSLGKIGNDQCIFILGAMVNYPEAVDALGNIHNPAVLVPLTKALESKYSSVKRSAVSALKRRGDAGAVPALIRMALNDEDIELRREAVETLNALKWQPDSVQMQVDLAFAVQDWNWLEKLGSAAVPRLIEELHKKENSAELRGNASKTLARSGDMQAMEAMVGALDDNLIYIDVLNALALMGPDAAQALTEAFKRQKPLVRAAIASTLGKLGSSGFEGLQIAVKDSEFTVKKTAVAALGDNDDPRSAELIDEIISAESDPLLRQDEILALGKKKHFAGAVKRLSEILSQAQDPAARVNAVAALGDTHNVYSIGPLVEALGDADGSVRKKAKNALEYWAFQQFISNDQERFKPANEEENNLLKLADLAIRLIDSLNAPPVRFSWSDKEMKNQRENGIRNLISLIGQLGQLCDSRATGCIKMALQHENKEVQLAASEVLKMR